MRHRQTGYLQAKLVPTVGYVLVFGKFFVGGVGEEGAVLERRERFGRGEDDPWTLSDILEIMAVWKQSEQTDDGQTAQTNDGSARLWRRRWRYSPRREGSLQHELRNSEGRDYYFVV